MIKEITVPPASGKIAAFGGGRYNALEALPERTRHKMKRTLLLVALATVSAALWLMAQAPADPLVDGFRVVEVSSVSDAMEQLYGQTNYLGHEFRPNFVTKFAGPAVTVQMKKEENKEGSAATQGMLDAIDKAPAGSVYVMSVQGDADMVAMGGLMCSTMHYRRLAGALTDGSVRDTPQLRRIQFPVYSRGVAPSTVVNHYRFAGSNVPVKMGNVTVNPGDIIAADEDGVVVVPRARAADILKKAQELDDTEHRMYPFIEKFKSIGEAVKQFGRI
jgi:4-hydroxy-4-methyl-2-oxoglutarate aldolase